MANRVEYKLSELNCKLLSGFAFKSQDYTATGIPLIKIGNIQNGVVRTSNSVNFAPEKLVTQKTQKFLLQNRDVLIAMTGQGSVGRVGRLLLNAGERAFLNQRVGKFLCDEVNLNIDYLYYILTSPEYQDLLFVSGAGSGQPNLSPEIILDVKIPHVGYKTQTTIAEILSSLDDKIELNNQINQELEALAQTLFKQWFIDFDFPNENGQPYKSSGGEMVESPLGQIPKEWSWQSVSDICRVINGRAYKNSEFELSGIPIIRIQNLNGGTNYVFSNLNLEPDKYAERDDLIFAWSATFGPFIWRGGKSIFHYHIWKLECFDPAYKFYLYHHLQRESVTVSNLGTGSIFTHITKGLMESQKVLKPTNSIVQAFHNQVSLMDMEISNLVDETNSLTDLRNFLLPRLISGELEVSEALMEKAI